MNDQDEMFETATELPAAKLLACNERSRARIAEIAYLANECILNTNHPTGYEPGQYGKDYRTYGKAMSEIRKLVKESIADVDPDYEMLALQFARKTFDFSKFKEALAAVASMKPNDFPGVYYTPDWLARFAKEQLGESVSNARKPTMDFGSFHVTRAAIPGTTILTFRRKRHVDAEHGSVVPGRIIVANIFKSDVGKDNKLTNQFVVKSYEAGEHPRVLFSGQTWVNMSKTEKMVYKMVKCNVKETQRRHISRKRARAARSEFENGGRA